jgi:uncharacterized repeat protein (TIGR03803 family)
LLDKNNPRVGSIRSQNTPFLNEKTMTTLAKKLSSSLLLLFLGFGLFCQSPYSATLLGISSNFGPLGNGTVFRMQQDGSGFQLIRSMGASAGHDGIYPVGSLVEGPGNFLYGMTYGGGVHGDGTVYKIRHDGTGFAVIHHLKDTSDGKNPYSALMVGMDNALYGVTSGGGSFRTGTLFKVQSDGSGFQVLHHFNSSIDGGNPWGTVIQLSDTFLYGMAYRDGLFSGGAIYKIKPDGSSFQILRHLNPLTDGSLPHGSLLDIGNGKLYGLTHRGGTHDNGTIFSINPSGSGFTVYHNLNEPTDGARPIGQLNLGGDGYLYGLCQFGGNNSKGTLFRILPTGANFGVLHHFTTAGGHRPQASLTLGGNGKWYGTASLGGSFGVGTVFSFDPFDSTYTVLHHLLGGLHGGTPIGNILIIPTAQLPVEWTAFEAEATGPNMAHLKWTTSREQSNSGFDIQRSMDGLSFERVGWVPSQGDAESSQHYAFTEQDVPQGTWYYRLRQVDVNGATSFSELRSVSIGSSGDMVLYPNPVERILHIRSAFGQNPLATVFDGQGKVVKNWQLRGPGPAFDVDISSLKSGVYFLVLRDAAGNRTRRMFVKR